MSTSSPAGPVQELDRYYQRAASVRDDEYRLRVRLFTVLGVLVGLALGIAAATFWQRTQGTWAQLERCTPGREDDYPANAIYECLIGRYGWDSTRAQTTAVAREAWLWKLHADLAERVSAAFRGLTPAQRARRERYYLDRLDQIGAANDPRP